MKLKQCTDNDSKKSHKAKLIYKKILFKYKWRGEQPTCKSSSDQTLDEWKKLLSTIITIIFIGLLINQIQVFVKNLFSRQKIQKPPGSRILILVEFFCSPLTLDSLEQTVANWREEHFDALQDSRKWKAHWVNVRYRWACIKTLGFSKIVGVVKGFVRAFK